MFSPTQEERGIFSPSETYRLDSAQLPMVSVDLQVNARVVEGSGARQYLEVRIALDLSVAGEPLAEIWRLSPSWLTMLGSRC